MKKNMVGFFLIAIGALTLLGNYGLIDGDYFLLLIGGAFLAAYFMGQRKSIGFLIPGCIVTSVGLFSLVEGLLGRFDGSIFFFFLGAAFIAIHYIHLSQSMRSTTWSLYVGVGLLCFGAFVLTMDFIDLLPFKFIFQNIWPVGLIAVGGYMLLRNKID